MPSVLFVCTANICRSPMAMALFRSRVENAQDEWRVESAGTWAMEGRPPAKFTQAVLQTRGLDVSDHRSRSVSKEMLSEFNLILTMENNHKTALKVEFSEYESNIYMLSEMIGEQYDIQDPIGGSMEDFEITARDLEKILEEGYRTIKRLAQSDR